MSNVSVGKGQCLCGSVKVTANTMNHSVGACNCTMCRKWGGGPLLAVDCGTDVVFEGEDNVEAYDSSEWAARGFCTNCGNHLFYKLKGSGQYFMPVGLFDNVENMTFDRQVFIDEKPDYYCFANKTHDLTGKEAFEMYGAS